MSSLRSGLAPLLTAGDTTHGKSPSTLVGAVVGVVVTPSPDQATGVAPIGEQMLVEAFATQRSVEALDEAVLHRFARSDRVPFNSALLLPF